MLRSWFSTQTLTITLFSRKLKWNFLSVHVVSSLSWKRINEKFTIKNEWFSIWFVEPRQFCYGSNRFWGIRWWIPNCNGTLTDLLRIFQQNRFINNKKLRKECEKSRTFDFSGDVFTFYKHITQIQLCVDVVTTHVKLSDHSTQDTCCKKVENCQRCIETSVSASR